MTEVPDYTIDTDIPEGATCGEWMGAFQRDCGHDATQRIVFEAGTLDADEVTLFKCKPHARRFRPLKGADDVQPV